MIAIFCDSNGVVSGIPLRPMFVTESTSSKFGFPEYVQSKVTGSQVMQSGMEVNWRTMSVGTTRPLSVGVAIGVGRDRVRWCNCGLG